MERRVHLPSGHSCVCQVAISWESSMDSPESPPSGKFSKALEKKSREGRSSPKSQTPYRITGSSRWRATGTIGVFWRL